MAGYLFYNIPNPFGLDHLIVLRRVHVLDPLAMVQISSSVDNETVVEYLMIASVSATAVQIKEALNSVATPEEELVVANYTAAIPAFRNLPNWATWTPADVDANIGGIFLGWDKATASAWIDANVTSLATVRTALKHVADAIIDLRTVAVGLAKAVLFVRNLIINVRN